MTKKDKTRDAVSILHGRYLKDDPERTLYRDYYDLPDPGFLDRAPPLMTRTRDWF